MNLMPATAAATTIVLVRCLRLWGQW